MIASVEIRFVRIFILIFSTICFAFFFIHCNAYIGGKKHRGVRPIFNAFKSTISKRKKRKKHGAQKKN